MTAKAAVVGWPIEHSLSPVLHGHWLKEYGIDGSYEKIAIEPSTFAQRIAELREAGYRGVNVTVPFKEEAFALADTKDDSAQSAGAVNLLVFGADGITGRNTDSYGLMTSLKENIGALDGRKAVLLGAGGAARGAFIALQQLGVRDIHLLARNQARALEIAETIATRRYWGLVSVGGMATFPQIAQDAALVVNATSAGMGSNPPLSLDLTVLPSDAAICDIVYHPLETPLLKDAKARGLKTIDGLGMLMHQAAPSFAAFFGIYPDVTPALRAELMKR